MSAAPTHARRVDGAVARASDHDLSAEGGILGGIFIQPYLIDMPDLAALEPGHFYDPKHRVVFAAMRNVRAANRPIDLVTVEGEIRREGNFDAIGGVAFLGELSCRVAIVDNAIDYVRTVQMHARNRQAIVATAEALTRAQQWSHDPSELVSELRAGLDRTLGALEPQSATQPKRYGIRFLEFIGDEEPGNDPADVFDVHGIIVRGEPGLIIGVPKVGKTMLVEDLILHIAAGRREWCGVPIYRRCRVLLFLREDSERTTIRRLWQLARGAGIERRELDGYLDIDVRSPLYFDVPEHITKLKPQLRDYELCTIDSLSTIHNADENSVERMAPIMNTWRDLSLATSTGMPLIHHFRKEGNGQAGKSSAGILQRARGSSVIGATTRHAVGVEAGPAKHQIVLSFESNHEIDTEPFVICRRFGADDHGRKWIRHERVGSMRDAQSASDAEALDPTTLEVIRGTGIAGINATDLRAAVNKRLQDGPRGKGIRPAAIDASAKRLQETGAIERRADGRWRVSTMSGGAAK